MFESEERRIAERIKDFIKNEEPLNYAYIMLRNRNILFNEEYYDMVSANKINPQNAYVYVMIYKAVIRANFYYPFLTWYNGFLNAYLSKLGFHYEKRGITLAAPATGLKCVALAVTYVRKYYLSIEVVNLDTAVNNTNLHKIVFEVVGEKLISGEKELTKDEYNKIRDIFDSQRLFAGYNVGKASRIIADYYDKGNRSRIKEVACIVMDYYDIFHPYTVCYETRTWKEADCLSIKL